MATLSFKDLKKSAAAKINTAPFAIVIGPRAMGKSSLLGTLSKPVIILTTGSESHGIQAARTAAIKNGHPDNVIEYFIDRDDEGKEIISADAQIMRVNALLDFLASSPDTVKEIGCVAFDSLSSLDKVICKTKDVVTANTYERNKVIVNKALDVISKLKNVHARGVGVICTCAANSEADPTSAAHTRVTPVLGSYGLVNELIGAFDDVLIVGPVLMADEEGKDVKEYVFQTGGQIERSGKTFTGQPRSLSFNPRITGIMSDDLPMYIPANLDTLFELKASITGTK